jgi:hypothetical protein
LESSDSFFLEALAILEHPASMASQGMCDFLRPGEVELPIRQYGGGDPNRGDIILAADVDRSRGVEEDDVAITSIDSEMLADDLGVRWEKGQTVLKCHSIAS